MSIETDAEEMASVNLLMLSHDATTLAACFGKGKVQPWNTRTGVMEHSFDYTARSHCGPDYYREDETGHFSPDSTKFAFTCCNGMSGILEGGLTPNEIYPSLHDHLGM
ncbi:uncharacterized protein N7483_009605 [Penicillium malachiteum]|uniref:uncharacterized protein n=1 Tax=Penicillium malachiteum TaxID=1324776 RepID=UPI0025498AB9|nr:uncharacterized protein N7483_009605 [Penicillium malachiteum]KAJ5721671.1 hypothetical protein N7483_009605 [Penicillium malachiteum]